MERKKIHIADVKSLHVPPLQTLLAACGTVRYVTLVVLKQLPTGPSQVVAGRDVRSGWLCTSHTPVYVCIAKFSGQNPVTIADCQLRRLSDACKYCNIRP